MNTQPLPELAPVRPGEELDWESLDSYLRSVFPDLCGPMSVQQFPRGSANLTYLVTVGETSLVVRRPPLGQLGSRAHDMGREHRVLSRLHRSYRRAPRSFHHCDDDRVIGAEFFVSEYRRGVVIWDQVPESMGEPAQAEHRVGLAVVDALADLHAVDPADCGLEDLGRPDGYLERQLTGWQRRWTAVAEYAAPDVAARVESLSAELHRTVPRTRRVGIVHNDFKLDNCQFQPDDPDVVTSVFDWDMATLGDTLVDLGTLLNYWPDRSLGPDSERGYIAASATRGLRLPTRQEVCRRYAERHGVDLEGIEWYEAFGCWKTVVILQQLFARHARGETSDPRMQARGAYVDPLTRRGLATLTHTSA